MPVHPAGAVARHVRDLVERQRLDALADGDLLVRYRAGRDDGAFAALVRRHGPMVLGTCRRILSRAHDAEDACQATFLVLARKAGTVRGGGALAGWLHRVAVRAASRLRRDLARRPTEPLPPDVVNPAPAVGGLEWREVRGAFDTEVGRLPDRFRLPLVLCYLQGKTRAEAATELGWSEGAVRGRLERGRKLLQSRFVRRGITLPAALLTLLAEDAGAGVAETAPTSTAARLADALLRSMSVARAKAVGWAIAATLMLGTLVGVGMYGPVTAGQKPDSPPPAKAAPPAVADAERNLDTFTLRITLAPAGKGKFDPRYELYSVFLYVPNLRLEPPENGPSGKPVEAHARITKEQAKKITAALKEHEFFDDVILRVPLKQAFDRAKPHAALTVRHQNGEDATTRERVYDWAAPLLKPLDAVRACVDGDAAVALDRLLGQLDADRKNWDSRESDLKLLQGSWVTDFGGVTVPPEYYAKCVIDGNKIVFKPRVQTDPVLDLETIRGKFTLEPTADGKWIRGLAIAGVRDTVTKTETGEWFFPYEVTENHLTLTLTLPGGAKGTAIIGGGINGDAGITGEVVYQLRLVREKGQSTWGDSAEGLRTRITAAKTTFALDENVEIALDVKADAISRNWVAGRDAQLARVEVNGVWYAPQHNAMYYIPPSDLAAGSEVKRWVVVRLGSDWVTEDSRGKTAVRALDLKPGKYTIRLKYTFWAAGGEKASATPVTGPLQIEVLDRPKGPAAGPWGEPAEGVRLRARPARLQVPADETPVIAIDAKADADGPAGWLAPRAAGLARVQVDGVWYVSALDRHKILQRELKGGEQIDDWVTVGLTEQLFPEQAGRPAGPLVLTPGRHTVRVGYTFASDRPAGKTATPVSAPIEIEILPAKPPEWKKAWSVDKVWNAGRNNSVFFSPDGNTLALTTDQDLRLLDVSGPAAKETAKHTLDTASRFVGWSAKGEPAVVHARVRSAGLKQVYDVSVGGVRPPPAGDDRGRVATLDEYPTAVALSPDGARLALMRYAWDTVQVFDVATGAERRMKVPPFADPKRHALGWAVVFSPDGRTLVGIGGNDYPVLGWKNGAVAAWDVRSGDVLWQAEEVGPVRSYAFSADGRRLATGAFPIGDAHVRGMRRGEIYSTLSAPVIGDVALDADGRTLIVSQRTAGADSKAALIVSPLDRPGRASRLPVAGFVRRVVFRPDGRAFVTADENGDIALWVKSKE